MKKKSFALRVQPEILEAMQCWADDELRSLNGQLEFVLRESLLKAGRIKLVERRLEIEMVNPAEGSAEDKQP